MNYPCSPRNETDGLVYFPRLADKIRLHQNNDLHPDFQGNMGKGFDLWTCQFLGVDYEDLKKVILAGASDEKALAWARENGSVRDEIETAWWNSFMRNRGFHDDISENLATRRAERPEAERARIHTFFDYLDADEGRF